jgi:hypothetical protein
MAVPGALVSLEDPYEIPVGRRSQPATNKEGGPLEDEDILIACSAERRQSAGFEEDAELLHEREIALNYSKGQMDDMPYLPNRSKAVSMDVADAIETALPDLVEIFTGGDDVLTFKPLGPDDEKQAEQETDYVKQVLFNENDGFGLLFDAFKDALQVKVGVLTAWWEDRSPEVEDFEGKSDTELLTAKLSSEISNLEETKDEETGQRTWSFTATRKQRGRLKVAAIPPEDFTVARDCVKLRETTYCAWRARPRAQKLLKEGVPRDVVDRLPAYGTTYDETLRLARDTAGEYADQRSVTGLHDLRQVEVITHFIEIDADGEGPAHWKIVTGNAETVLISKEKVRRIDIAAITPYRVPHRFYGESLADKLLEIQREKTAMKRMLLDSGYFALNQRMEVAETRMSEWTMSDLLRLEPGVPVRSKTGDSLRTIEAGQLNFDVLAAIEALSVESEQRTGIVRNAQGLNPDTLHETAHGVLALLQASTKRLRLIAQLFAETGLKDFYLIVHALLREHDDEERITKIKGSWVPLSPTSWDEREMMVIEVGQGSAGQALEVQSLTQLAELQEKIVQAQMAMPGVPPVVTAQNVYNLASRIAEKMGEKRPDAYFSDPSNAPAPQGPPPPHPEQIKAQAAQQQAMMQAQQQEADRQQQGQIEGAKLQLSQAQAQAGAQLDQQKFAADVQERQARLELDRQQAERDDAFRYAQLQAKERGEREKLATQAQLAREGIAGSFGQAVTVQHMKDQNDEQQRQADLEIQASEQRDAARMADKSE